MKKRHHILAACSLAALLTSCIDEDLSKCPGEGQYDLHYRLHVSITQFQAEINEQLPLDEEQPIGRMLSDALKPVFGDLMYDVNLNFYNADGLAYKDSRIINAAEASFELFLPADEYAHHAVANSEAEANILRIGEDDRAAHFLSKLPGDEVQSQSHGIYVGRLDISDELSGQQDSEIVVDLYMTNCATAVVLNLNGNTFDEITAYATGFADSFGLNDLEYSRAEDYRVRANLLDDGAGRVALYSVQLPSGAWSRADGQWQFEVYVRKGDSTTKNVLTAAEPVDAGQLRVLKGSLDPQGRISSSNPTVGVSVTLDWNSAGEWDVPM